MKTIRTTCRGFTAAYDKTASVLVLELVVDRLIDFSLIGDIEREIKHLVGGLQPIILVIGFQNVTVFSSEVISVVLDLQRTMIRRNGSLWLTGLRRNVGDVFFQQLNFDGAVVQIYDTTSKALAELELESQATV